MRIHNTLHKIEQHFSQVRLSSGICFVVLQGGVFVASSTEATAQTVSPSWADISKADQRINACRVSWKRVLTVKPIAQVNVDKRVAEISAWAQQQGMSAVQVQRIEQSERREAQRDAQGRTVVSELTCVRVGEIIKCDILYPETKSRSVDFYDGKNSVFARIREEGAKHSADGDLSRDVEQVLSHSIGRGEVARFLVGIPLQQMLLPEINKYSPENTRISKDANGNFLLASKTPPTIDAKEYPGSLTISKGSFQPISYESFRMGFKVKNGKFRRQGNDIEVDAGQAVPSKGALYRRIELANYKQFMGGISFPSKITVTTPTSTEEYSLLNAAFNDAVDPMETLLPASTRIADARFGRGKQLAIYKLKDGQLPSDKKVLELIGGQQEKQQASQKVGEGATTLSREARFPLIPITGLIIICLSCLVWVNSTPDRSNKS